MNINQALEQLYAMPEGGAISSPSIGGALIKAGGKIARFPNPVHGVVEQPVGITEFVEPTDEEAAAEDWEAVGEEPAADHQCCGKCEKPTGPQFAKVFQTERGQIVAMLHQDSKQNPAILLWFDAGIDGLAPSHLALGFTDDEEGEAKARVAFDNLDQSGVERVVFQNIDNLREHFEVAP